MRNDRFDNFNSERDIPPACRDPENGKQVSRTSFRERQANGFLDTLFSQGVKRLG